MAKREPDAKSRVVFISKEDNKALKQYFLDLENSGASQKPRQEIVDELFKSGLYAGIKSLRDAPNS